MSGGVELGFVAALEREVEGAVRGWRRGEAPPGNGKRVYQAGRAVLICAGTGMAQAHAAAQVLVEQYSPKTLISIGFAGACVAELAFLREFGPGALFVPEAIIDSASGRRYQAAFGSGTLATLDRVAGRELKAASLARYGAQVVDMEAAGVAAAAEANGVRFVAIKAISDGADEDLDFLSDFVTPEGFETVRFVAHIALRPRLWSKVSRLRAGSDLAAKALESAITCCVQDWNAFASQHGAGTSISSR